MVDPLFSVEDQTVLVSGGSRGIGWAIAAGFAQRGSRVVITGRQQETLDQAIARMEPHHARVIGMVCDVASQKAIAETVDKTIDRFGRIDTLVNVAGVNRRKAALEITEDDYDFVMDINLKGAFRLSQLVGRQMIAQAGGSQINISSLNNDRPLKNVSPYAMSKAAIGQMTRALAMEWGAHGVRVNAIAPGFILTDLTRKLWSDAKMQDWGLANTPQRRLGKPEDMVGTAIFLASAASEFLTGQIIYVDGGFTAGWAWPIEG